MRVEVKDLAEATKVIETVLKRTTQWHKKHNQRSWWTRFAVVLKLHQEAWWLRAFNISLSAFTIRQRKKRKDYYKNPKRRGVTPPAPGLSWSYRMRNSTSKLTKRFRDKAYVDTQENYRRAATYKSKIPYPDPAVDVAQARTRQPLWNIKLLDSTVNKMLEPYLKEEILHGPLV
jgi:hypothetical protein